MSMLVLPGSRSDEVPALVASLFKVAADSAAKPRRRRRTSAKAS
jgi:lipid A disaccharide synthetase